MKILWYFVLLIPTTVIVHIKQMTLLLIKQFYLYTVHEEAHVPFDNFAHQLSNPREALWVSNEPVGGASSNYAHQGTNHCPSQWQLLDSAVSAGHCAVCLWLKEERKKVLCKQTAARLPKPVNVSLQSMCSKYLFLNISFHKYGQLSKYASDVCDSFYNKK